MNWSKPLWVLLLCLLFIVAISPGFLATNGAGVDKRKLIALTFDDGPGPYTEELLDALKERNAKATFFLVGNRIAARASVVLRQSEEGHQIGNHSWSHAKLTTLDGAALAAQLNDTAAAITAITGKTGFALRPPYGSYNSMVKDYAGTPIILWSVDTLDWKYKNAETVKNTIINQAQDGAILLLHDIHATSVEGAIAALDVLQSEGYEFVTVEELFKARGITAVAGKVYSNAGGQKGETAPVPRQPDDGKDFDETNLKAHWAYEDIKFVRAENLFSGTSEQKFSPDKYMTRAMFVTVLWRLDGAPVNEGDAGFSDVSPAAWYGQSVAWAKEKGVITGTAATEFSPDKFLTREQLAAILLAYSRHRGISLPAENPKVLFDDDEKISDYAKEAVYVLESSGIVAGMGDHEFQPGEKTTRAQAARICHVFTVEYVYSAKIVELLHRACANFSLPRIVRY